MSKAMSGDGKQALVPKLRFPEFRESGTWVMEPLGQLAEIQSERVGSKKVTLMSITAGVGLVSQMEKFGREIAGNQYKSYFLLQRHDFAYNKSATKEYPEGFIGLYTGESLAAVPNSIFVCFRLKDSATPEFINYQFFNNLHGKWLRKFITVGARAHGSLNVDNADLLAVPVPLPPETARRGEQQKIADCLSSLDALIAAHTDKLAALKTHKQGLLQQLFPQGGETVPRLRFPEFRNAGEWEKAPIGSRIELLSGFPFKSAEISEDAGGIPLLRGINITEGYIRHNQDIDRYFCGDHDQLEKYRVRANDIVIGMDGSKVGKNSSLVGEYDAGSLLIQRVARLRARRGTSIQFVFHHVNSDMFRAYVDRINTSSGIPHISAQQIKDFAISFPGLKEQEKVAGFLSNVDTLITAQTDKLAALKQHKQGLLQQLFPAMDEVAA